MAAAESASGPTTSTVAPRPRRAIASTAAAERDTRRKTPMMSPLPGRLAVGFRHSTRVPRPAGAASMLVGLQTPPSTYSRPPIRAGANSHGTVHEATTAWATVA